MNNVPGTPPKPAFTAHPHLSPKLVAAIHELELLGKQVEQSCGVENIQVKICNYGLFVICGTVDDTFCVATEHSFIDALNSFDKQVRQLKAGGVAKVSVA